MSSENIIPNDYALSLSDYQQLKLTEAYNKLVEKSKAINEENKKKKFDKRIYNLSFKEIGQNFFTTWVTIIEEMTELIYDKDNNRKYQNYMNILLKDDRIIYVGIFLVLLSLFLFFIFLTR